MSRHSANPSEQNWDDPAPDASWKVRYWDTFDREMPPGIEASGRGLAKGLYELWIRHLYETVTPGMGIGFSRFNLVWDDGYVTVDGDLQGALRLREWAFFGKASSQKSYRELADVDFLQRIAILHAHLVLAGQSSEAMLQEAAGAPDKGGFEAWLFDALPG